jgi:hypothetical protein
MTRLLTRVSSWARSLCTLRLALGRRPGCLEHRRQQLPQIHRRKLPERKSGATAGTGQQRIEAMADGAQRLLRDVQPFQMVHRRILEHVVDGQHRDHQGRAQIVASRCEQARAILTGAFGFAKQPAQLQLGHGLPRKRVQRGELIFADRPLDRIQYAQRAQRRAVRGLQQCAGVELQAQIAGDQRVSRKTRVVGRVRHHQQVVLEQGVRAKRLVDGRLADAQTDFGLEPLTIGADQAYQRNRRTANGRRNAGDVVERRFARGIENFIRIQHSQTPGFRHRLQLGCAFMHAICP